MICSQIKQKIPQWLDGELEPEEVDLVSAHLEGCEDCRREADFWRKLSNTLKEELGDVKAPPGFTNAVMAQLSVSKRTDLGWFTRNWKHSLAVAATFLLVAVGSISIYMQMSSSIIEQVANNNGGKHGQISNNDPNAALNPSNIEIPEILSNEPNKLNNEESNNQSNPGEQVNNTPGNIVAPNETEQESPGGGENSNDPPSNAAQTENDALPASKVTPAEHYALLNTDQDRVIERTFVRVKVENMTSAHKKALTFVNNSGAQYEVIGSDNALNDSQENLKIVVENNLSGELQEEFKTLGQVLTSDTQEDNINSRYNEKVEQYRSLESLAQAAETTEERNQLQVKMDRIKAQLIALDLEANTETIILWLEN